MDILEIYTDGSIKYRTEYRFGTFGVYIIDKRTGEEHFYNQLVKNTSGDRTEMMAMLKAVKILSSNKFNLKNYSEINIYSDSQYVVKSFNEWIHLWIDRNELIYKKNQFILKEIYNLLNKLGFYTNNSSISINWIKGHNGNLGNEIADFLCKEAYNNQDYFDDQLQTNLIKLI